MIDGFNDLLKSSYYKWRTIYQLHMYRCIFQCIDLKVKSLTAHNYGTVG